MQPLFGIFGIGIKRWHKTQNISRKKKAVTLFLRLGGIRLPYKICQRGLVVSPDEDSVYPTTAAVKLGCSKEPVTVVGRGIIIRLFQYLKFRQVPIERPCTKYQFILFAFVLAFLIAVY